MNEKITAAISSATERYAGSASLRTAVQLIPYIGGPLDTLLEGKGSEIRMRRLEAFVSDVSNRLAQVTAVQCCDETELFDLMFDAMNKASQARLDIKRTMYANIVTRHIVEGLKIDETGNGAADCRGPRFGSFRNPARGTQCPCLRGTL